MALRTFSSSGFPRAGKEALVHPRGEDKDDSDANKRTDAEERVEASEIVQEQFQERDAHETQAGVPDERRIAAHADNEQRERKQAPRDRISHIAGEARAEIE